MAINSSIRSTTMASYINEDRPNPIGEAVIFINGICNQEYDAKRSAQQISSLVGRRVVLFYPHTPKNMAL